jgi:hypothetical protein
MPTINESAQAKGQSLFACICNCRISERLRKTVIVTLLFSKHGSRNDATGLYDIMHPFLSNGKQSHSAQLIFF